MAELHRIRMNLLHASTIDLQRRRGTTLTQCSGIALLPYNGIPSSIALQRALVAALVGYEAFLRRETGVGGMRGAVESISPTHIRQSLQLYHP